MHALFEDEALLNIAHQTDGLECGDIEARRRQADIEGYIQERLEQLQPVFDAYRKDALAPLQSYDPSNFLESPPVKYTAQDIDDSVVLMRGLFANWLRLHGAEDLLRYRFLASELYFDDLRIPKPTGGMTRGWRLAGVLDALLQDRNTGEIILRELKTTSGDASKYEQRVDLDPQVRLYAQAAELAGLTNGQAVEAVQYVVLRKKIPRVPGFKKCPKCKGKEGKVDTCGYCPGTGQVPSTDKRLDTTKETLLAHLASLGFAARADINNPQFRRYYTLDQSVEWYVHEDYFDLVDAVKRWKDFISVNTYFLDVEGKAEALWEAQRVTQEIADATRRYGRKGESHVTAFPRNISQCTGPAGFCQYKQLCIARTRIEDFRGGDGWSTNVPDNPEIEELKTKKGRQ